MNAIERLQSDLDQLQVASILAYTDDPHFEARLVDAASVIHAAIGQRRAAAKCFLTREAVAEWMAKTAAEYQDAAARRGIEAPIEYTPLEATEDPTFATQLDQLRSLLALACQSPEPNASEIRRVVATIVRVERQYHESNLATGEYLNREAVEAVSDRFADETIAWSKANNMPQETWESVIDELIPPPKVPA